jgi:hypothetical protein
VPLWAALRPGDADAGADGVLAALRRTLDEMNGVVAAAAGAMRDLDAAKGRPSQVQSPIFAHPQFEHLEAEGAQRVGPALQRFRDAIEPDGPQP